MWRKSEADIKKITSVEMGTLRKTCKVQMRNRIDNEQIKELMKIAKTLTEVWA